MGIEAKLAYRERYLQSEEWKDLRYKKFVRDGSRCEICGEDSIHNDIHHVFYPRVWSDTSVGDVVVLCRNCHSKIHLFKPSSAKTCSSAWETFLFIKKEVKKGRLPNSSNPVLVPLVRAEMERFKAVKTRLFKACLQSYRRTGIPFHIGLRKKLEGKKWELPIPKLSVDKSIDAGLEVE